MNSILKSSIAFLFLLNFISAISQTITPEDGNWTERNVTLTNTSQAELMVRVGDIDNLNFGWPVNFDPFSGKTLPLTDTHGHQILPIRMELTELWLSQVTKARLLPVKMATPAILRDPLIQSDPLCSRMI